MGLFDRILLSKEQKEWGLLKTTLIGAVSIFIDNSNNAATTENLSASLTQVFIEYAKFTKRTFSPEMIEDAVNFFSTLEMLPRAKKELFFDLVKLYFDYQSSGNQVDEWRAVDRKINLFFIECASKMGTRCF